MVQVVMKTTMRGQETGKPVLTYDVGQKYDITCPDLLKVFLSNAWAEEVSEEVASASVDTQIEELFSGEEELFGESDVAGETEHGLTAENIREMKVKDLKLIVEEYTLDINISGMSKADLAESVIKHLGLEG